MWLRGFMGWDCLKQKGFFVMELAIQTTRQNAVGTASGGDHQGIGLASKTCIQALQFIFLIGVILCACETGIGQQAVSL
jgi:hypothetical protein